MALALVGGCKDAPTLFEVKGAIESELDGVYLERQESVRLGRFPLAMARVVLRPMLHKEDPEVWELIKSVRRVAVASYRVKPSGALRGLDLPPRIGRYLESGGWEILIRERTAHDRTWVFLRQEDQHIGGLYVITLDDDELEMVRVEGNLERALAVALADEPEMAKELFR
jgi:hypothetical protein